MTIMMRLTKSITKTICYHLINACRLLIFEPSLEIVMKLLLVCHG